MLAFPDNSPAAVFAENRARLWSIAYRMLGSRADADDAVQEAYLRWHDARVDEIRSPQAWLVTTTTRLCIDRLKQLRAERERYVGPWLPEPIVDEGATPHQAASLASDLSVAMLAVLERLAPEERAAFLLHEMFDSGYDDIARILGKSEAACRQIVSRARKRVHEARPRVQVPEDIKRRVLDQFMHTGRLEDRVVVANVALVVDLNEEIAVPLVGQPVERVVHAAFHRGLVLESLVLAEVVDADDRDHAKVVGLVEDRFESVHIVGP